MSSVTNDVRLGLRLLRKQPAFAAVCIFALSIGIGLTTMTFSMIYGVWMRGLPYPEGDRIVMVSRTNPSRDIERQSLPLQEFHDYAKQVGGLSAIGAFTSGTMNVSGTERAERYDGSWVTASLLNMTGIAPTLGRTFLPGEDAPNGRKVAVLGHAMWKNRFGSDPGVIGTTIRVNGQSFEVVGVMPEKFLFPSNDDLWLPLQTDPLATSRDGSFVEVVGKLAPGTSLDQLNVELSAIAKRLEAEHPRTNEGFTASALGFIDRFIGEGPKQMLYTMLGAVFFVLLIACTNVANLLLDRAAHRTKEVGVRSALGASRAAIMRVFLVEALVLALAGTALGIVIAHFGIGAFNRAIVDTDPPFFIHIALHPPVLLFAIGVSLVATLFAGLIPALQASRSDIAEVLKDDTRGSSSLRIGRISRGLVIFEVALSCGLLVAAGQMIMSVVNAGTTDKGFAERDVFTARVGFPAGYTDTLLQRQFFAQLDERLDAVPGVQKAAISSRLPGARSGLGGTQFAIDGKAYTNDRDYPRTSTMAATPDWFETLSIPLRSGRLFNDGDRIGTLQVAVVNERFVRDHLNGKEPLGQRIRYGTSESTAEWLTIVGVIPDLFAGDPEDPRPSIVIRPFAQEHSNFAYISMRSAGISPMALADPVRRTVAALNPDIPIYWPMTLEKAISEQLWFVWVFGTLFIIFGGIALFLAAIGLYAVMSFSVSRRKREVGIRMALGATGGDVMRLVLGQGAWQLLIGLVLGLGLAAVVARLLTEVLFDVNPYDPVVFGGVVAVLALSGMAACAIPARRATLVHPSDAIRTD